MKSFEIKGTITNILPDVRENANGTPYLLATVKVNTKTGVKQTLATLWQRIANRFNIGDEVSLKGNIMPDGRVLFTIQLPAPQVLTAEDFEVEATSEATVVE